jgi:hypothetical protein
LKAKPLFRRPPKLNARTTQWVYKTVTKENQHLKADKVGPMAITDNADFHTKVRASRRQVQNNPEKIRSFYQKPSLKYAACKVNLLWTD